MTPKRAFFAMLGSVVLLVGLCAAGTFFANKMLAREGSTLHDLKLEQSVLDKQEDTLAQAKKDIAEYEDLEAIAKSVVPQEKDQANTMLEILALADESGITISRVTFPQSKLGEIIKKKAAPTQTKEGEEQPAAPVATPKTNSDTTQLTEVPGSKGLYTMQIQVESDAEQLVTYQQLLTYLRLLENNRRTAQVKDISISPSATNRNLISFTLTLNTYVRP